MPHEVIMPQLGMAQDTGVIVAWHKAQGDTVSADEILMEVETDKATVEVPAGQSGLVAEILAEPGEEIPVGETVAIIAIQGETVSQPFPRPEVQPSTPPDGETAHRGTQEAAPQKQVRNATAAPSWTTRPADRVLASPKARSLARRFNIGLQDLVRRGVAEPIHAADVEAAIGSSPAIGSESMLSACVDCSSLDELLDLADEDGIAISKTQVLAAFASGSLRAARKGRDSILVACRTAECGKAVAHLLNADHSGLKNLAGESAVAGNPDLTVIDLTGTRMSECRLAGCGTPTLTVACATAASYSLALRFNESNLHLSDASAFLDDLASRITNPMRHLL